MRRKALTASTFYVLLSLSTADRDARGILEDVAMSSAGRLRITMSILTTRLRRLIAGGAVRAYRDGYRLTREGRRQLADELERMERAVRFARTRGAHKA